MQFIPQGSSESGTGSTTVSSQSATSIEPIRSYAYDANGNMTTGSGKSITWSSYDKPIRLQKDQTNVTFKYGPERNRYQRVDQTSNKTITTTYVDSFEKVVTVENGQTQTEYKHYIMAEGTAIAIQIKREGAGVIKPDETRYFHHDNLGSIDTITDGRGNIVARMSFEPFGERRDGDWKQDDQPDLPEYTERGFTGHEHIDNLNLIHMNGRVYDPAIGRFLSADPIIKSVHNTQNYNRYHYVTNNPLKYTDPSGFVASGDFSHNVSAAVRAAYNGRVSNPDKSSSTNDGDDPLSGSDENDSVDKPERNLTYRDKVANNLGLDAYTELSYRGVPPTSVTDDLIGFGQQYYNDMYDFAPITPGWGPSLRMVQNLLAGYGYGKVEIKDNRLRGAAGFQTTAVFLPAGKGKGLVTGATKKVSNWFSGLFSKKSSETVSIASGVGKASPMQEVRGIEKGEKISDIVNEAKGLTFNTGNEYAVVTLANGKRALVSGGPGGIDFAPGQISRVFGHTHPTSAPPSAADSAALSQLGQSKQYVYHGGEVTMVRSN